MAINENALKRMHKELSRDYDNLGDYNSFAATMQNSEEARRSVHQALSEKYGKEDVGDYDYFMQQMGFEMPEAQQTGGVDAATGITAQHGVVAGGNVQQMNQQKRAQLAERMKQQNAAETAVANAQNAANDKGYQQFKQGYNQYMKQGGMQKRPQQQEQTQQVPQTTGNEPSNFVDQASQNAPEFYDVAMGKEKPDYGMQQSGQQDQTLVPLSREESQRTAKERREISSKIRTEQELQRAATTKNVVDAMKRTYDYQTQLAQQGNEVSMEKAREAREAEVNAQRVREAAANYTYDYVVRPAIDKALGDERFGKEILKVQDAKESARMLDNAITDEAAAIYARTAYGADFGKLGQDQRNGIKNELDGQMAGQMVEELSRLKAPTSAIEYYQRKVRGSMMMNQVQGFITNVLGTEYAQMSRAVEQSALTNYENSKNDKWYGGVLTGAAQGTAMFLDMMLMDKFLKSGATSWMNNVAAGSLSGYSAAWAPGSRGVAQAVVDKLVNNAWTNGIIRGSAAMASQYLTFGRIDAVNAGLGILNDPNLINRYGSLNTVGGWLNELGSDASNIVSAYAHGGETGAKLFTIGHLTAGIPGITGKALGFGAEVGFFTVNGVKEKIDEHNSMNPNDQIGLWDYDNWTQETLTNVGMIGAMKLMGTGNALAGADLRTRSQRMRDYATSTNELMKKIGMEFDRDDFYALERAGLGKMKSFDFDMMQKLMESGNYDRLVKSNELPLTTLFKLRMAMEHRMGVAGYTADDQGNVVATMNPYDLVKQAVWSSGEHGRFNVTAYGMNDEVVMQKSFGTPDEAKKYALALNYKGADNGRRMMEMMVGDNMHIVKDAIHEWADENGVGRLDAEEVYADWLAERENAMPLAKEVSEQIRNKIWAKMSENRQAIIAEIREDIRQKTGVDLNGVLQKPANMLTQEERDAFDQYTKALEERKKDDTTDPAVRIVEKTMDPKSGTVKFGTDSTGREVTVKEGEGKEVILTDPNTGEPIGMVDGKEVEITNEVPAEQVVEANKAAVAEAERQAGSEPVEEKPTENAPVAEEELPNGALAEEGTPIKYYDENNDLVDGTYIGPDHMQSWKHVIKDKNGNVVSRRLDEDEIVLPEAKAETTAKPINEAPAETENVNGTGTAPVASTETAPANAVGAGMPLNAKGKPDPIGNGVTPERALQYLEQERGMEPEIVKELIDGQVKKAGEDIAKYVKKKPDASKMDPDDYIDAYEQWKQGGMALREIENRWKAISEAITAREEAAKAEQRARQEAIRKQMAAEEQARIDKIREEQRKETEERERTHREFMAELERKRKEQEALEAEQANEELTGDQMAEQAVMEEQKRRERMRIGQRLAEVGQLTDLDQPADEAMAAQVAYLSPDFKVTPESLRLELGSNFGKFGREGMLRLADKNGRTISEIADAIVQAAGYDDNGQWRLDANKVREELIKCIQEGSASAIEALEKRVGIGTQRPEDRPEYWTDEKIAEYEARQQQNQQMTEVQQQIATASEMVNTSPTDAQKEAGNYKKGHVKLDGMEISIEQPKGSTRSGVDADGLPWSVKMNNTYGYIRGTKGKDKDHIDIFLSDNPEEGSVFVVDQIDPRTGEFDEHKVMYGFNSLEEAREAYLSNYMSDWQGLGNITEVNKTAFKVWLSESVHKTKPFADYRLVKAEQAKMGIERGYDERRDPFAADQTQEFLNGNEGLETIDEAPFSKGNEPYTENVTSEQKMASNTLMTALKDNAGIDVVMNTQEEGQRKATERNAEMMAVSEKFDNELQQQIDGTLPQGHIYQMGKPSQKLMDCGIPDLPITMNAARLKEKASQYGHDFDLSEVKGLVEAINNPVAVFDYGKNNDAKNIIVNIQHDGKNFLVGLFINPVVGGRHLEINSIRNVFPRNTQDWVLWIQEGKLRGGDTKKIQALIDKQRKTLADVDYLDLNDVAKILENGEYAKFSGENILETDKNSQNKDYLKRPNGTVYGWVEGNKIHLTPEGINPNTPIHEYSHLWAESVKKNAPKLWENVKGLMKETDIWKEVLGDELYQNIHGDEDRMASEVLSRLSGRRGAEKLTEMAKNWMAEHPDASIDEKAAHLSIIARMKQAIKDVWNWVGKELFGIEKFGSAEEVADRTLYDLMNGTDLKLDEINDSKTEFSMKEKKDEVKVWTSTRLKKLFKGLDGVDEQTKDFCSVSLDFADNINEVKTSLDKSYMGQPHVREIKVTVPKSMTYEKDGELFVKTSDINEAISKAVKEASDFAKANERKMVRDESTIGTGNEELIRKAYNNKSGRYDEKTVKLDENNYVDAMFEMSSKYTNRVHDELQSLKNMVSYNEGGQEVNNQRIRGHVGQFEYTHIGQNDIVGYKDKGRDGQGINPVYGRDIYKAQWEKLEKPMQEYKAFYERMKQLADGVEPQKVEFNRVDGEKKSLAGMHNIGVGQLEKALKQGGLANPSTAVIDVDKQSHDKYGAVTLLMPTDLVAANSGRHSGAYAGDIYSPNYPQVHTMMDRKDESRMEKWLIDTDNQGDNKMASYMNYRIKDSLNRGAVDGLEYLYLKEKGVDMSQIDEYEHHDADYQWKKIVKDYDHWYKLVDAMKKDEQLSNTVNTTILNKLRADFVKDIKPREGETMQDWRKRKFEWWNEFKKGLLEDNGNVSEYLIEDYFNEQWKAYHTNGRFEDRYTAGNASQYVNEHNLRSDYERWANEKLQQFNPKEKLYNGTDRNGNAKYVDNTLENASKIMKKQGLRAGDSFFAAGMGGARAQLTPVFKTLKEIKENKGRLDSEAFNKQKQELENEYFALGKLFRDSDRDFSDQNYYRLIEAMKSGDAARWAERNGYKLSEEDAKRIDDFGTALRLMPTDYFEIKFERPVGFEEFAAAIVPESMDQRTIKALQDKGLEVRTYKDGDEADRANVMRGMVADRDDILFNRTWHGSAANFDEFDNSFMGTGEGSQVYGWGTYVSEVDGIAKSYANIATTKRQKSTTPLVRWKGRAEVDFSSVNPLRMAYDVVDTSRTIAEARQRAERYAEMAEEPEMQQKWQAALDILKQSTKADFKPEPVKGNRHLYEVEIPEDNGKNYLSWNDAVSADMLGRIKEEAVKEGYEAVADMVDYYTRNDNISGGDLYNKIIANGLFVHEKVKQADAHKMASKLLNNAGIVGVKVPTNNLRGGDKSKNNYVIFDEKNAQIVDHTRYNQENGENGYQKMTVAESDELTARLKDVLGKDNVFAMDQDHFDKALDKVAGHGTAEMIRDEGGTVYGFAVADKIYYNTDKMNAHTPVHEHGHIWTKVVKEKNPELYQRGMNLWKGAGLWDKVKSDMQRRGEAATDDAVLSEVVSLFTGQTNEKAVAEITGNANKSFVERCKQWLEDWWQTIKDYVGKSAFSKWSQEELDRLTKEEFASMPLKALYDDAEAKAMRKAMGEGDQTRSENFKKWFGDWENDPENASKVVNADGKPMVVYHGTQLMSMYFKDGRPYVDYTERFHTFKDGKGFFTSDRDAAESFARGKQGFYEVYLDMKKPFVIDCNGKDWDAIDGYENPDGYTRVTTDYIVNDIKRNHPEYDGVIFKNVMNENSGAVDRPIDDYVPFKAEQIKSAVDNNGDFSRENKDIRFNRVDPENPDDDPTTPGGGGSPSPTGGRERSLEEMIEYDAQEFSREFNRMKSEQDQIVLGTRVREFIRNRMTPLAGKRMTASDINGLMRDVDYAITHKSKKGLERALDRMQNLIHQAEGLAQIEEMMKALNTRTTTQDKRGMVKGVLVDETANEVLKNIKSSYQQMLSTSYDDRMSEVRREMRALKEQYGITRQDDPTAPEEFKTKMQELKDKLGALKDEREGVLTSQVNETVEGLNEMEANIDNEINNLSVDENGNVVKPDPEKMTSLEQLKMALPIRRQLAELRQMMSAKQEIQKELDRTGSPKERHRLEKEMDMMQRRINITSREITEELKDIIGEGRGRRAEQVRADIERQMQIVRMGCNAVRDAEVQDTMDKKNNDTTWKRTKAMGASVRDMWQSPIFSFNFMAKYIDHNNAQGDGDFYTYFMKGENGALKANNVMSQGIREFGETVDSKCKEIFGKGIDKVKAEAAKVTNKKIFKLKADRSIPEEEWGDDSKRMTKGQMLYAWMSWRQEAGRTKMEADGWTKRSIAEMEEQLGPEMLELGRWITDDFLKALRDDKYNVTYEKVMGTSMHKANHYFPLRIDKLSIQDKSEVGQDGTINLLPSASSGNLIVRTTNRLPVDLSNDAFDVLEDYGRTMERWNAMAELTKDLNTLIKSQGFRNLMEANHEGLFDRWKDACAVATASYNTKATDADKFLSKLHNGFMQQAIGYGWYTAIKQTLSAPAFWAYSWDPKYIGHEIWHGNVLRSYQNYKWAKDNLPSFAERIAANDFGIEAINDKTFADYVTRKFKQGGMAANKLVDAMTVANGARAVYEYDSRRFKKMTNEDGSRKYTDEQAEELAKVNAQIVFNESQQSSRNEFSAPIQKQRGIMQRSLVAFQNSNIGYRRMLVEGMEDLIRKDGNKSRGLAKVATVGILNAAWYMGLNPALTWNKITGKTDDEEDEKFWDDMMLSVMLGYAANGTLLGPAMTAWTSEHAEYSPIQVFDALKTVWTDAKKHAQKDEMGAMSWAIIDYALKAGGVNLEKFDNMYNGLYNAIARGEVKSDDILSILNMARSQRRELANHDLEEKTATEYMVDVMRADKKIEEGDRGRGWWNGDAYNKILTDKKRTEIINDYVKKSVPEFEPLKKQLEDTKKLVDERKAEIKKGMPKAKKGEGDAKDLEAMNQAIDEVLKDDPEMLKAYKQFVNGKAGVKVDKKGKTTNETYAEKYKRLTNALNEAVKALEDGSGSYTRVDNAAMELIWLESDIMKAVE